MRKYIYFLSLTVLLFSAFTITSFAANDKSRGVPPEVQEKKRLMIEQKTLERQRILLQKQQRVIERGELNQTKNATREARLDEQRKVNIRKHYQNLNRKYLAMIDRLEILIGRINSRVATIEAEENINLTNIKMQLNKAQTLLDEAKADLQAVNNTIDQTLDSNEPKASFSIIRESLTEVKKSLVEVHRILVKIIGDVKGLKVGNTKSVSPSPTTVTSTVTSTLTATVTPTLTITPTEVPVI